MYGTWELSWTCLDCSQAVQVSPKYRQVARSFADGLLITYFFASLQALSRGSGSDVVYNCIVVGIYGVVRAVHGPAWPESPGFGLA